MTTIQHIRRRTVRISKALANRTTVTVVLAAIVALGTAGCLLVPFPVGGGGGGHHHHRY